jgi:putative SbcD/Mre11-related phosphoesterase
MTKVEYIGKCLVVEMGGKGKKEKKILVIGDLHLGYEEALNESGVLVNRGSFDSVIKYLDKVFEEIGERGKEDDGRKRNKLVAHTLKGNEGDMIDDRVDDGQGDVKDNNSVVDEIVLMGDVKHVFGSVLKQERGDVIRLVNYLIDKIADDGKIVIIKGNHDAILEPILRGKERIELLESYICGDVCFVHGDKDNDSIWASGVEIVVIGHVHPAIRLQDNDGVKNEKYKCFLSGEMRRETERVIGGKGKRKLIVVPSFSDYNEGIDLLQNEIDLPWKVKLDGFEVRIVQEDDLSVLDFGKLGKIR